MAELMAILLFVSICLALMAGYPVAFTLGGMALLFAGIGVLTGTFDPSYLSALPNRLFGIVQGGIVLSSTDGGRTLAIVQREGRASLTDIVIGSDGRWILSSDGGLQIRAPANPTKTDGAV